MAAKKWRTAKSEHQKLFERVGPETDNGCWPWIGGTRANGYGTYAVKRAGKWTKTTAHRVSHELFNGPIPDGYEVDHLCHNRACVNPDHLEAVTVQENRRRRVARKTHCAHGHEYTEANTYRWTDRDGYSCRFCIACRSAFKRAA